MNEEVKKILFKFSHAGNQIGKFEHTAQQICQLFPKSPDNPDGYEPKPQRNLITEEGGGEAHEKGFAALIDACLPKLDIPLARVWSEDGVSGIATGANKPDKSRLLTRAGFMQYIADNNLGWREEYQVTGLAVEAIAKAQRTLTASIMEAKFRYMCDHCSFFLRQKQEGVK